MFRKIMILSLLSTLFGCGDGDGKPGLFSAGGYHVGKQKVWYKTSTGSWYAVKEVEGADAKTFEVRELSSNIFPQTTAEYGIDKNSIFWAGTKIDGADLTSFEYLCNQYSKDKNAVYYMYSPFTNDVAHLEVVNRDFVKDASHVYLNGDVFSDDPAHFALVSPDSDPYFKDSRHCWYNSYLLEGADPATIRYLGERTAADAKHVYFEMNTVEGADLKTYRVIKENYAQDAHHIYLGGQVIADADPVTFQVIGQNYSKDDKRCFYHTVPMAKADPATFQLIDDFYSKDARQVYINATVIDGADPATFRVLNSNAGCSCDAKHAYVLERRIEGADPTKFPTGECKSCNESGVIF